MNENHGMHRLTGHDAIAWARANGIDTLSKYADQIEDACQVDLKEAAEIAAEDQSLIFALLSNDEMIDWGNQADEKERCSENRLRLMESGF